MRECAVSDASIYKVRSVPLMPQIASVLAALRQREHFTTDDDLVFVNVVGEWIDQSALYRRYKAAQRRATSPAAAP